MLFSIDSPPGLVGIARMAAEGPLVGAKRRVVYRQLAARSLISRCDSPRVPFRWTINPYRGCEFGCRYCYARYTHEFMELRDPEDFERQIFAKAWSDAGLRRELGKIPREDGIAIGTATDPYQPAERRFHLTRRLIEALVRERGRHLSFTTKSDLVARDAELLAELSRRNVVHVNFTVTTVDEALARLTEPLAPRPELRLKALAELRSSGVLAGVFASPVLPGLTDSAAAIDDLARAAAGAGAVWLGGGPLFLKPSSLRVFLPLIEEHFPNLLDRYRTLFRPNGFVIREYAKHLEAAFERARKRHGLRSQLPEYMPELWAGEPQLSLFAEDGNPLPMMTGSDKYTRQTRR